MSAYDKYAMLDTWVTPPRQNATQTASNCRTIACTTTTVSVAISSLFAVNSVPNQPAANQGELPAGGPTLVRFHAKGGDIWILFGPNANVIVDPTDATAAQLGDRIPQDQYVDLMLDPVVDQWISARTASSTATLKYRLSSPLANNRP